MTEAEAMAALRSIRPVLAAAWEALGRRRIHMKSRGEHALVVVSQDWFEEAAVTVALARETP